MITDEEYLRLNHKYNDLVDSIKRQINSYDNILNSGLSGIVSKDTIIAVRDMLKSILVNNGVNI